MVDPLTLLCSTSMDPWCEVEGSSSRHSQHAQQHGEAVVIQNSFQDSFLDKNGKYEPLPDSAEYLNILETKLRNISSGKSNNKKKNPWLREEVISNLLRSESKQILGILSETDLALDREVDRNQLIARIIPKQPITAGETVQLIKSDILDQNYSSNLDIDQQPEIDSHVVTKHMDPLQ